MYLNILLLQHTTETCPGCFWCWFMWMLLSGLLGLLLGWWLWGKYQSMIAEKEGEIRSLRGRLTEMEKNLMDAKYKLEESEKDNHGLKASLQGCEADKAALSAQLSRQKEEAAKLSFAAASPPPKKTAEKVKVKETVTPPPVATGAKVGFVAYFDEDNLQIIEGVGPKIEGLLKAAGYSTWEKVGNASYDDLKKVLSDAGPRYRIHDPKTWARQAQLAHQGKWAELIEFQKFLDTGRDNKGDFETPSKVEKLIAKKLGFSAAKPDDLKIVEGIGPKIEGLLKAAGINNWADLAASTVERLKQILTDAGDRYRLADPSTWPEQAGMAHRKEWNALKEYQDFLQGGRTK